MAWRPWTHPLQRLLGPNGIGSVLVRAVHVLHDGGHEHLAQPHHLHALGLLRQHACTRPKGQGFSARELVKCGVSRIIRVGSGSSLRLRLWWLASRNAFVAPGTGTQQSRILCKLQVRVPLGIMMLSQCDETYRALLGLQSQQPQDPHCPRGSCETWCAGCSSAGR